MEERSMEIREVRMSIAGRKVAPERSENISRLMFDHVHQLMDRQLRHLPKSVELNYLGVGPIEIRLDVSDDETIARESAFQIYRALLQTL